MEEKNITPSQYFDYLKDAKKTITNEELQKSFEVFTHLAEKYNRLGQKESLKRLCFLADTLKKEEKIIELGITTFIYKDVIEDYIINVKDQTVKIVELSRYMREVPDELVDVVEKTRELFDEFYVVFTDYTGKQERKVEQERRDKDPILFGVFKNSTNVADRFYFLGDWVDEYCDLTLDKLVDEYRENKGYNPTHEIEIPKSTDELVELLDKYKSTEKESKLITGVNELPVNMFNMETSNKISNEGGKKKSFFEKVRSVFKK